MHGPAQVDFRAYVDDARASNKAVDPYQAAQVPPPPAVEPPGATEPVDAEDLALQHELYMEMLAVQQHQQWQEHEQGGGGHAQRWEHMEAAPAASPPPQQWEQLPSLRRPDQQPPAGQPAE